MSDLGSFGNFFLILPDPVKTFLVAVPSAVFGAFLSAYVQSRKITIDELRGLSVAHVLCFTIANKALALKKQHVMSLCSEYENATLLHDAYRSEPTPGYEVQMNFLTLAPITFSSPALEKLVYEKLFIGPEGVATINYLILANNELNETIKRRNDLVNEYRINADQPIEQKVATYFGLYHNGNVDDRFRNNIDALRQQTDDCIFFAKRLSEIIVSAENMMRRSKRYYFLPGLKLQHLGWKTEVRDTLLPSDALYAAWTDGFAREPSLFARLIKYV